MHAEPEETEAVLGIGNVAVNVRYIGKLGTTLVYITHAEKHGVAVVRLLIRFKLYTLSSVIP